MTSIGLPRACQPLRQADRLDTLGPVRTWLPSLLACLNLTACRGPEFVSDGGSPANGGAGGQGGGQGGGPGVGAGGTAGSGPPVDVEVDVVFENYRAGLASKPVIVHDPLGAPVFTTATDIAGAIKVTVPAGGFVTVVEQDEGSYVYTAKVLEGTTTVRFFSQSDDGNVNDAMSHNLATTCSNTSCTPAGRAELHRSCEPTLSFNLPIGAPFPNFTVPSTQYSPTKGCPETPTYETTFIFYGPDGSILRTGNATAILPSGPLSIPMAPVSVGDVANVVVALGDLNGDWTHDETRFQARDDQKLPIRTWDTDEATISLVRSLATNLLLRRGFMDPTSNRAVARFEEFDVDDVMPPFGLAELGRFSSLGIPTIEDLQGSIPWQLDGRSGDMLLFSIGESVRDLTWYVMVPAESTGEALLPTLPVDLLNLTLENPDSGIYLHFDVAGGYADALAAGLGPVGISRDLPYPMTVSSILGQY